MQIINVFVNKIGGQYSQFVGIVRQCEIRRQVKVD